MAKDESRKDKLALRFLSSLLWIVIPVVKRESNGMYNNYCFCETSDEETQTTQEPCNDFRPGQNSDLHNKAPQNPLLNRHECKNLFHRHSPVGTHPVSHGLLRRAVYRQSVASAVVLDRHREV